MVLPFLCACVLGILSINFSRRQPIHGHISHIYTHIHTSATKSCERENHHYEQQLQQQHIFGIRDWIEYVCFSLLAVFEKKKYLFSRWIRFGFFISIEWIRYAEQRAMPQRGARAKEENREKTRWREREMEMKAKTEKQIIMTMEVCEWSSHNGRSLTYSQWPGIWMEPNEIEPKLFW